MGFVSIKKRGVRHLEGNFDVSGYKENRGSHGSFHEREQEQCPSVPAVALCGTKN